MHVQGTRNKVGKKDTLNEYVCHFKLHVQSKFSYNFDTTIKLKSYQKSMCEENSQEFKIKLIHYLTI